MKKSILTLLLLLAVAATAFAQTNDTPSKVAKQSDLTAKVPVDKKVRIGHLDNGITYYIRANKKPENRVQFRLVNNAGSILEDDDQQGLAHFCEHMAFNGTQYYKSNEMISTLQKNGIEFGRGINAWTSFDETVYYVDMPTDNPAMVEMGFKILDGWASKLLFQPDEIEHERGVILEEWRGGLGAEDRLRKATWPTMFKDSKYANRLPIGLEDVIRNFKRETIVRFYNDWYRPDLQAIVIVGDINVDSMEAKVKEYFGNYTKRANPRQRPTFTIPGNVEPLITIATDKEATSSALQMFWKHAKAPQGTVGDYRTSLVRNLINGMLTSRFSELCEKSTAPMIAADAGYSGFLGRTCDAFTIYAMPKQNRIDEAATLLLTEIRRVDQHGFLQAELDRQKEALLANYKKMAKEANKTQSVDLAQEYTNNYLEGEVIPGIRQEYAYAEEFIPTITLEEVNSMVATWITDENFVVSITAPEKADLKVPTKDEITKIITTTKHTETTPWVDNYKDEPLFSKQLADVQAKVTKENKVLDYTEYTLPNGIRFIVKKTELKADEIRMMSYGFGGTSLYENNESYMASIASSLIDDAGIADFSSSQLEKKLKGLNVSISPDLSGESQGFHGNCSPKDLETMLQLLTLYYDAPRKDKESFDKNMEAMRTQYKFIGENPQYALIKKLYETAYQNDPRMVIIPSEEQLNSVNLDRTYEIFKERFADASNQTFFFVGNIADSDIQLISKYLGNLPCNGKQKAETWKDRSPKFAPGIQRAEVRKGSDNQGMFVIMGKTEGFNTKNMQDRLTIKALSDAMTITALEEKKKKMGGTYSPSVSVNYDIMPTGKVQWMFFINCDPNNMAAIEAAALDIMKTYIKKGPNKETLNKVKEQMIHNRQTAKQENGFWAGQIYGSYYYNEDRDANVANYDQMVNAISAKSIKAMAKQFIDLNHFTVVTLKPETK